MRSLCGVLVLGFFVSASYAAAARRLALTAADYPAKMKAAVQANVEMQKALKAGVAADAAGSRRRRLQRPLPTSRGSGRPRRRTMR